MLLHVLHTNTASLLKRSKSAMLIPSHTLRFLQSGFMMANAEPKAPHCSHKSCLHTSQWHLANSAACVSFPHLCIVDLLPACSHPPLCAHVLPPVQGNILSHWLQIFVYTDVLRQLQLYCRFADSPLYSWSSLCCRGSALRMPNIEGEVNGLLRNIWWMPGLFNPWVFSRILF